MNADVEPKRSNPNPIHWLNPAKYGFSIFSGVSTRARIFKNLGVVGLYQVLNFVSQILFVFLAFHVWSKEVYGEWIILTCIPSYLVLSEVGMSSAAGNEMSIWAARKDYEKSIEVFHTAALLIRIVGILLFVVCISSLGMAGWLKQELRIASIGDREFFSLVLMFIGLTIAQQQTSLYVSAFRCGDLFVQGNMYAAISRTIELVVTLGLVLFGSFFWIVFGQLVVKSISLIFLRTLVKIRVPWLHLGVRNASFACLRRLCKPSLSFMVYPLSYAMMTQGTVFLIARNLGSDAVAIFAMHRTLLNTITQALSTVNYAIWPELTLAYGKGDMRLCRSLHRKSCGWSMWLACVGLAFVYGVSFWFVPFWTSGKVEVIPHLLIILCLAVFLRAIWYTSDVVATASNRHQSQAIFFLVAVMVGFMAMYGLPFQKTLPFYGCCLAAVELLMGVFVIYVSLALTQDRLGDFSRCVLRTPLDILPMLRGIRSRFAKRT